MPWDASLLVDEDEPKSGWDPSLLVEDDPRATKREKLKAEMVEARKVPLGQRLLEVATGPAEFAVDTISKMNPLTVIPRAAYGAGQVMGAIPNEQLFPLDEDKPLVDLQQVLVNPVVKAGSMVDELRYGAQQAAADVGQFFVTPRGISALAAGGAPAAARGALAAGFAGSMAAAVPEAYEATKQAFQGDSTSDKTRAALNLAATVAAPVAIAGGALRQGLKPAERLVSETPVIERTPDASKVSQAVREVAQEVPQEAPAQVSGERVPAPTGPAVQSKVLLTPEVTVSPEGPVPAYFAGGKVHKGAIHAEAWSNAEASVGTEAAKSGHAGWLQPDGRFVSSQAVSAEARLSAAIRENWGEVSIRGAEKELSGLQSRDSRLNTEISKTPLAPEAAPAQIRSVQNRLTTQEQAVLTPEVAQVKPTIDVIKDARDRFGDTRLKEEAARIEPMLSSSLTGELRQAIALETAARQLTGNMPEVPVRRSNVPQAGQAKPETVGGLSEIFSAKGATDVLYDKIFTALEQGKDVVSGVNEPLIPKAKPFFDAGLIKSGSDLKALVQSGEINKPIGSVGPGAASPKEFAQRERREPTGSTPVGLPSEAKPNIEVARANKDYNLFNNINSSQWAFSFGRLGESAKAAIERIFTGEFKMRESINKDTRVYVERTMGSLPRPLRKQGGKAFFDVVNGRKMEEIRSEWESKPGGDKVIAASEQLKTRLEEVRTTIRDTKRESYNAYLKSLDEPVLNDLFVRNMGEGTDVSRFDKTQKADALTLSSLPDDWGIADGTYLPHLFFGNYKVTAGEGAFVTRAKTLAEAKAKIYQLTKNNLELSKSTFKVEQDTVVPADMIRLGDKNFWRMVGQMKESLGVSAAEIKEAQAGIIGSKASKQKWFGSLQERQGFEGYSKDFKQVMTAYLNGFHRWKELSAMQRDVQPLIEKVRSEGRPNAANRLDEIMENLWGKPAKSTVEFDAFVRQIPGVRDWIKPLALDRWSRNVRSIASLLTLRTVRFATVNRLQPLQGLYPVVGERLLVKGKAMQHSAEGKALLDEGGVSFDVGQYAEPGAKGKLGDLGERFSGEKSNQELAFLSMFLHGQEQGMGRAEAIQYAKLRGQLMTQFTPLVSDIPKAFSGPFGQLAFQFKRFPVKQAELAAQLVRERNFGGITRMMGVFAVMGGASFFMRQTMLDKEKQLRMRRALESELGKKGADVAMYGLPGLVGADLSGSLVLGDEPFGENIYEKAGRQLAGPAVSLAYETGKNILKPTRQKMSGLEKTKAIIRRIPSLKPLAEIADLESGNTDVMTPDGEIKYRRAISDAIAGLGSFRSANEANKQLAINGIIELKKETQVLKNSVFTAMQSGDPSKAIDAVKAFNTRWPEAAITGDELTGYLKRRQSGSIKTDEERTAGRKFRPLLDGK